MGGRSTSGPQVSAEPLDANSRHRPGPSLLAQAAPAVCGCAGLQLYAPVAVRAWPGACVPYGPRLTGIQANLGRNQCCRRPTPNFVVAPTGGDHLLANRRIEPGQDLEPGMSDLDAMKERSLPLPGGCWKLPSIRLHQARAAPTETAYDGGTGGLTARPVQHLERQPSQPT
jgi:hypothetical protein